MQSLMLSVEDDAQVVSKTARTVWIWTRFDMLTCTTILLQQQHLGLLLKLPSEGCSADSIRKTLVTGAMYVGTYTCAKAVGVGIMVR